MNQNSQSYTEETSDEISSQYHSQDVDLSGSRPTTEKIQKIIANNITLSLDASDCGIRSVGNPAVSSSNVRSLNLSYNHLNEDSVRIVCQLPHLQELMLSGCSLKLAQFEVSNQNLQKLDLGYNDLSGCAQSCISRLFVMPKLVDLNLETCQIQHIDSFKKQNSKLEKLSIQRNDLDSETIEQLIQISTIKDANFEECVSIVVVLSSIQKTLKILPNIQELDVSHCFISDINRLYPSIERLTSLKISNNNIGSDAAQILCQLQFIQVLHVRNCGLDRVPQFSQNAIIHTLDLSSNNLYNTDLLFLLFTLPFLIILNLSECNLYSIGQFDPLISKISSLECEYNLLDQTTVNMLLQLPLLVPFQKRQIKNYYMSHKYNDFDLQHENSQEQVVKTIQHKQMYANDIKYMLQGTLLNEQQIEPYQKEYQSCNTLNIYDCAVASYHLDIICRMNLNVLVIQGCTLDYDENFEQRLSNIFVHQCLQHLSITECHLYRTIKLKIQFDPSKCKLLSLDLNRLKILDSSCVNLISEVECLREIKLEHCGVVNQLFRHVEVLDISNNNISNFNEIINQQNLLELSAMRCKIGSFSVSIESKLQKLNISSNKELLNVGYLFTLENLVELELSSCEITNIDFDPKKSQIQVLYADENRLDQTTINLIAQLQFLNTLDLSNNKLTNINASQLFKSLSLVDLSLNSCNILELELNQCQSKLQKLDICHNNGLQNIGRFFTFPCLINLQCQNCGKIGHFDPLYSHLQELAIDYQPKLELTNIFGIESLYEVEGSEFRADDNDDITYKRIGSCNVIVTYQMDYSGEDIKLFKLDQTEDDQQYINIQFQSEFALESKYRFGRNMIKQNCIHFKQAKREAAIDIMVLHQKAEQTRIKLDKCILLVMNELEIEK